MFDGASFALNADRTLAFQLPAFEEQVLVTEWLRGDDGWRCTPIEAVKVADDHEAIWRACVLGLKDYVEKNRFKRIDRHCCNHR